MAGLFEKDIRILMQRKKALLLFLALSIFIGYSQDGTFILSYLPMLMIIVMIGTISYDEYDNGYRFLMTLPIDSKVYVSEKYIFCIAGTLVSCIAATLIYLTSQALKGINVNIKSSISDILATPLIMLLFVAIILPLQIKYGAEKSRVTLLVVVGIIAALIFVFKKIVNFETLMNILHYFDQIADWIIILIGIMSVLIALLVSYLISYNIMKNKEF
jgi:ABC-2 type transport system permease protein